jgi:hypothetical protein
MNRGMIAAVLAGASIGGVIGALILCAWAWHEGGSSDPRCVFGVKDYFVTLHRLDSGADRADCAYRPNVARLDVSQ